MRKFINLRVITAMSNTSMAISSYTLMDIEARARQCANTVNDCLVKEVLLIKQLRPCLNVQLDSIRATVFV